MIETDAELDAIAATEIMGWEQRTLGGRNWWLDDKIAALRVDWHPTTDRNQSRLVVKAALERVGYERLLLTHETNPPDTYEFGRWSAWIHMTPRQEVEAAIMAVRDTKKSPQPND